MHFLKELEDVYYAFEVTGGRVVDSFSFPENIIPFFTLLFKLANSNYQYYCEKNEIDPSAKPECLVYLDESQKCYMVLKAPDQMTRLVIVQDDYNRELYKNIVGRKIKESELADYLSKYQERALKNSHLPKRFLSERVNKGEIPLANILEELNIRELVLRMQRNYIDLVNPKIIKGAFEEPDNERGLKNRSLGNGAQERVNEVIPYEDRKRMLLNCNPRYIFEFTGHNQGKKYEAYVYYRDGYTLCTIEPESGLGYQLFLNLGPDADINDENALFKTVKIVMESPNDVIMNDDAIIRKSHTTEDVFKENIQVFLNGAKSLKSIKSATTKSYDVYEGKLSI